MIAADGRRRSGSGRVLDAVVWGLGLGAAGGAVLGAEIGGVGAGAGAVIGALVYAPAEAVTTVRRAPAEPKPLWLRIFAAALLMALFGRLLGLLYDGTLFIAIVSGALLGLLGLRPLKVALGLLVGACVGALFAVFVAEAGPALVAATVAVVYRAIAAVRSAAIRRTWGSSPRSTASTARTSRRRGCTR